MDDEWLIDFQIWEINHWLEAVVKLSVIVLLSHIRAISRDVLGKMVIVPYRHHGFLGVRRLRVFNTSDPLKTYSVQSNT